MTSVSLIKVFVAKGTFRLVNIYFRKEATLEEGYFFLCISHCSKTWLLSVADINMSLTV